MGLLSERIKRTRHEQIAPYVAGAVLDVACGPAKLLELFPDKITSYCGIEYSESRVAKNQEKYPQHLFVRADLDVDTLDFEFEADVAVMLALVEHIFNQKHLMGQVLRHVRPGGRIVFTTPTPFGNDVVHRLGASVGLFSREAADDHIVVYNRKRVEILAKEFGLELEHYKRFQLGCNQLAVLRRPN